jgi:tetratricopeptide (TPR) repeat protein
MSASLTYIEAYFTGQLSDAEKQEFEKQCVEDESFAADVAFYITARQGIRERLLEEKNIVWAADQSRGQAVVANMQGTRSPEVSPTEEETRSRPVSPERARKVSMAGWISYAAAACLILAFAFYFLNRQETPDRLASKYVEQNYVQLGTTMNATTDSLQLGITAYNRRDYQKALGYFEGISPSNPEISEARKNAGLAYLMSNNYDKAIERFDQLAAMNELEVNSGTFLKALALMKRNNPGDMPAARGLLNQVVRDSLAGSKQAREWLADWKE